MLKINMDPNSKGRILP